MKNNNSESLKIFSVQLIVKGVCQRAVPGQLQYYVLGEFFFLATFLWSLPLASHLYHCVQGAAQIQFLFESNFVKKGQSNKIFDQHSLFSQIESPCPRTNVLKYLFFFQIRRVIRFFLSSWRGLKTQGVNLPWVLRLILTLWTLPLTNLSYNCWQTIICQ